jgi:hypothetical protein
MTAFLRRLEQDPYGEFDPEAYNTEPETAFVPVVPRRAEAYSANSPIGDFLAQIVPEPYMKAAGDAGNALSGFASGAVNTVGGLFGYGPDEDDMRNRYRSPEAAAAGIGAAVAPIIATPLPGEATAFKVADGAVRTLARAPKTTAVALSPLAASATDDVKPVTTPFDAQLQSAEKELQLRRERAAEIESKLQTLPAMPKLFDKDGNFIGEEGQIEEAQREAGFTGAGIDGNWGSGSRRRARATYKKMEAAAGAAARERERLAKTLSSLGLEDQRKVVEELRARQLEEATNAQKRQEAENARKAGFPITIPGVGLAEQGINTVTEAAGGEPIFDEKDPTIMVDPITGKLVSAAAFYAMNKAGMSGVLKAGDKIADRQAQRINEMAKELSNPKTNPNYGRALSQKTKSTVTDNNYADIGSRSMAAEKANTSLNQMRYGAPVGHIGAGMMPAATAAGMYTLAGEGYEPLGIKGANDYKREADAVFEQYLTEENPVKRDELLKEYNRLRGSANFGQLVQFGEMYGGALGLVHGMKPKLGKDGVTFGGLYQLPAGRVKGGSDMVIARELGATRQAKVNEARDRALEAARLKASEPSLVEKVFGRREPIGQQPPPNAPNNLPNGPLGGGPAANGKGQQGPAQGRSIDQQDRNITTEYLNTKRKMGRKLGGQDAAGIQTAISQKRGDLPEGAQQAAEGTVAAVGRGRVPRKKDIDGRGTYVGNQPILGTAGVAGGTAAAVTATPDDATAANAPGSDLATQRRQVRSAFEQVIAEEGGIPDELRDVRGARDFNQRLRDMGYNVGFSEDRHFEVLSKLDGFMAENGRVPTADEWPMIWGDPSKTSAKRAVDQPRGSDGKFVKLSSREKRQWQKRLQNMQPEE